MEDNRFQVTAVKIIADTFYLTCKMNMYLFKV